MILIVLSVFDKAASAYGRPVFATAIGAAVRSFSDEVNRRADDNSMFAHSSDFELYELGTFDDSTAKFDALGVPRLLVRGGDVREAGPLLKAV